MSFNRISKINQIDKDIVHGYIRRSWNSFKHLNIPIAINHICLIFFYEFDHFAECGLNMDINDKKDIVTNTGGRGSTCYGALLIANDDYSTRFIYQWEFVVLPYTIPEESGFITIGVIEHNCKNFGRKNFATSSHNFHIAVLDDGVISHTEWYDSIGDGKELYPTPVFSHFSGGAYGQNDVITITLDMKEKDIEFVIKDKDGFFLAGAQVNEVKFDADVWKYRVAIFLDDLGASVKMSRFDKVIQRPRDDNESIYDCFERCKKKM